MNRKIRKLTKTINRMISKDYKNLKFYVDSYEYGSGGLYTISYGVCSFDKEGHIALERTVEIVIEENESINKIAAFVFFKFMEDYDEIEIMKIERA